MQKVKTFFHVFINSLIPQYHYYHKILKTKFSFSFKYFLFLSIILSLIFLILLFFKLAPQLKLIETSLSYSLSKFPGDLVIKINKGYLKTNYNRPYFFWFDYLNKKILLLVIDETGIPAKINQYNSIFLVTNTELVIKNFSSKKNPHVVSLNYLPFSININKDFLVKMITVINKIIFWFLMVFISVLIFVLPFITFIINLFYLGIISLVSFIIYRYIISKNVSFNKTFQISLHSSTLPLVLNSGLPFFSLKVRCPLAAFFFLVLIFLVVGIYETYFDIPNKIIPKTPKK